MSEADGAVFTFLVTIDRDSEPRLYAELLKCRKGRQRVQRMRMLAMQGLLTEGRALTPPPPAAPRTGAAMHAVFGEPDGD